MNFYLKRLPTGRIYLSQIEPTKDEEVLKVVDAEAWIKARETIPYGLYEHREGHGYFH